MTFTVNASLLDAIVLAVVSIEDTYGYKITQEVNKIIDVSESTLYPVLRRLQKDNDLEVYDMEYLGRNRRYYKITNKGKILLSLYQEEWVLYKDKIDRVFKKDFVPENTDNETSAKSDKSPEKEKKDMTPGEKIKALKIGKKIDDLKLGEKINNLKIGEKIDSLKIGEKIENLKIGEKIDNLKIPERIENLKIGEKIDSLKIDKKIDNLLHKNKDKNKDKKSDEDDNKDTPK